MKRYLIRLLIWMVKRYGKPFKITGSYYTPTMDCEFHATRQALLHCDGAFFVVESIEWFPRSEYLIDIHCRAFPLTERSSDETDVIRADD